MHYFCYQVRVYSWGGMVSAHCVKAEHSLKQGWCFSCGGSRCGTQCRHSPSLLTCTMLPWPLSPLLQHFSPLFSAALCLMPAWRYFPLSAEHAKACQNYGIRKDVESISSKWEVLLLIFSYIFFSGGWGLSLIWTYFEPCLHFPGCESMQLPLQVP